jgi:CelD/BcsL family acetyltransferase involved in cellulose biosynthesis
MADAPASTVTTTCGNLFPIENLRATILPATSLDARRTADWERICLADGTLHHPFFSPGFCRAVALSRPYVFVCVIEDGTDSAGFLPFQFKNYLHRLAAAGEPAGGGMTDYFGLIADPNIRIQPQGLLRLAALASFGFHHLPESQTIHGLTGGETVIGHRMLLGNDPSLYWQELKKQRRTFVAETERRQRKIIQAYGPLRFTFALEKPAQELQLLIGRKRAQYNQRKVGDALASPWKRNLLARLAVLRDPHCTGVLSTLYAGDTWVASHFGVRNRNLLHYWFPVYNDDLAKFAPGHLLIRQIIENSRAQGVTVIDRGAGNQPHKSVYLTQTQNYHKGSWCRPGLRSFAHRTWQALAWRVEEIARRIPTKLM